MSVKKKLIFGFLSITLLIIILAVMNYTSLQNIEDNIDNLIKNNLKKSDLISSSRLSMEKSISNLKSFAMNYSKNDNLVDNIKMDLNLISKNIKEIEDLSSKKNKQLNSIIKDTKTLEDIIKEQVTIHNQKIALYFTYNDKFYNYENFFYKVNNQFQENLSNINKQIYKDKTISKKLNFENTILYSWLKNREIQNARLKKYIKKYEKEYISLFALLNENINKSLSQSEISSIEKSIGKVSKSSKKILKTASRTINMIENSEKINFKILMDLAQNISKNLNEYNKLLDIELANSKKEINETTSSTSTFTIVFSLITVIISLGIAGVASKRISDSLFSFQTSLLAFFKFINKESKDVKLIDIKSNDEFGQMAKLLNENIEITQNKFLQNQQLIDEISDISNSVRLGHLNKRINSSSDDDTLETLKKNFNTMIDNLNGHINKILGVFKEFENNNFTNQFDISSEGEIKELLNGVNSLAKEFSEILKENKINGMTLDDSAKELLNNVTTLNQNSSNAAASLEETAAAIEEVTEQIKGNTNNVIQMANYANELRISANKGENLANKTNLAMDEINTQVSAINEAISIIDQIAFQTNILSLNAAVEAATAGEAGKGFAVVAGEVRNLASRSADAAKEIKELVENANKGAYEGKEIANEMIQGYSGLNENINQTLNLIKEVETISKEQAIGIEQINNSVSSLDKQTQENVIIANTTNDIATYTSVIASRVIKNADEKEFHGKDMINRRKKAVDLSYNGEEKRALEKEIKELYHNELKDNSYVKSVYNITENAKEEEKKEIPSNKIVKDTSSNDEWESF